MLLLVSNWKSPRCKSSWRTEIGAISSVACRKGCRWSLDDENRDRRSKKIKQTVRHIYINVLLLFFFFLQIYMFVVVILSLLNRIPIATRPVLCVGFSKKSYRIWKSNARRCRKAPKCHTWWCRDMFVAFSISFDVRGRSCVDVRCLARKLNEWRRTACGSDSYSNNIYTNILVRSRARRRYRNTNNIIHTYIYICTSLD